MTSTRSRVASAMKNGRTYNALVTPGCRWLFCFDSLADAGMVCVISHGEENIHFEWKDDDGFIQAGFCKCL